ncbi:putative lipoprotein [Myxococcus hansupus]|uniref:Putative lipoprotein n=1 Tax=Pseudomyxococcus hansupus TaxID=1297742 RepID=A0A0H4WKE0_9BACT|nr:putative lipoprotein [Myxococcus hansupus]
MPPENLDQEVARLRAQVQRLEREVDTLRRTDTGTGGSGSRATVSDADVGSTVLASVVMQGQVASVGKDRIVVRDAESGATFNLFVTNTTRISANGRRVSPQQLSEGTPVQAAFNYIADGDTYATQIQAYPGRQR